MHLQYGWCCKVVRSQTAILELDKMAVWLRDVGCGMLCWADTLPFTLLPPWPPEDDDLDTELRRDAVSSYLELMRRPRLAEILVCQICWVGGWGHGAGTRWSQVE